MARPPCRGAASDVVFGGWPYPVAIVAVPGPVLISPEAAAIEEETRALIGNEAQRGARLIVPFLLPSLWLMWMVLADVAEERAVRVALVVQVGFIFVRFAAVAAIARAAKKDAAPRWRFLHGSAREITNIGSAWLTSAGFAHLYLTAAPHASAMQTMALFVIATAISGLAIVSMSARVVAYVGYISINLGSLALVAMRHPDPTLRHLPVGFALFVVVLAFVSARTNRAAREKIRMGFELREASLRDMLTGLRNRAFASGFAEQRSQQVLAHWRERDHRTTGSAPTLAFLLVDLDHFKSINDKHGHAGGDEVLSAFAAIAQRHVRAEDVVARWGGEEFLIVIDVSDRETALGAAERLRAALASRPIVLHDGASAVVTCSIGACLFPLDPSRPDALSWQQTVNLADGALYEAKRAGRNSAVWVKCEPSGVRHPFVGRVICSPEADPRLARHQDRVGGPDDAAG